MLKLAKTWLLLLCLFSNVELDFIFFIWFHNTKQSSDILNAKVEMLFEFQNAINMENIRFFLMHFQFFLNYS